MKVTMIPLQVPMPGTYSCKSEAMPYTSVAFIVNGLRQAQHQPLTAAQRRSYRGRQMEKTFAPETCNEIQRAHTKAARRRVEVAMSGDQMLLWIGGETLVGKF